MIVKVFVASSPLRLPIGVPSSLSLLILELRNWPQSLYSQDKLFCRTFLLFDKSLTRFSQARLEPLTGICSMQLTTTGIAPSHSTIMLVGVSFRHVGWSENKEGLSPGGYTKGPRHHGNCLHSMTVVINVSVRIEIDWPSGVSGSTGYRVQGNDQEEQNVECRREECFQAAISVCFRQFRWRSSIFWTAIWKVDKMNSPTDSAYQLMRTTWENFCHWDTQLKWLRFLAKSQRARQQLGRGPHFWDVGNARAHRVGDAFTATGRVLCFVKCRRGATVEDSGVEWSSKVVAFLSHLGRHVPS